MITVSVVEDNDQFRSGLEAIIKSVNELSLIGSYANAEKGLKELPENPADIVIVDISLPGMRGTEMIVRLKDKMRQTQFMV